MIITPGHLGWIPPSERTDEQHEAHEAAMAQMPTFALGGGPGAVPPVGTKVMLTDYWKHPAVVAQLGFEFPGIHQITGSCVGAGGGNMLFTLNVVECISKGTPEAIVVPFWLLPYGRSRLDGGMRGKGEGSLGSTFAQAVKEDGVLDANDPSLPKYTNTDQLVWGKDVEMTWSDGAAISKTNLEQSRKHLVKTTSPLKSADEVRDSILNGYPVTRAFGTFCNPGDEKIVGTGENQCVLGNESGRGGHQMTWLNWWRHPELGELFYEMNQWGLGAYKTDPAGGPRGGGWKKFAEVDAKCNSRDAEVIAFSGLQGFPARNLLDFLPTS